MMKLDRICRGRIKNKLFKEIVGADNVKKLQDSIGLHHSGNRKEDYIRIIQDARLFISR